MKLMLIFRRMLSPWLLILSLLCMFGSERAQGLKQPEDRSEKSVQQTPILVARFELPISPGPAFDKLRIPLYEIKREDFQKIAVRICSDKPLLLSLPSGVSDPFEIINYLKGPKGRLKDLPPIFFLRSEDCVSTKVSGMYATELWVMNKEAALPPHVESYEYEHIKMLSLGFDPSICKTAKIDSQKAVKTLVRKMRSDSDSFGVIIGYYFLNEKPHSDLEARMKAAEALMSKGGIPGNRYDISYQLWHADDSNCSTQPVKKPSIFFMAGNN